jgi:hypothetical protein
MPFKNRNNKKIGSKRFLKPLKKGDNCAPTKFGI